jgi:hypothetical protein
MRPVSTPEVSPIVATVVSLLDQTPPEGVALSVVASPIQTAAVPVIAEAEALTVTKVDTLQPGLVS